MATPADSSAPSVRPLLNPSVSRMAKKVPTSTHPEINVRTPKSSESGSCPANTTQRPGSASGSVANPTTGTSMRTKIGLKMRIMDGACANARARATGQNPGLWPLLDARRPPMIHRAAAHSGQAARWATAFSAAIGIVSCTNVGHRIAVRRSRSGSLNITSRTRALSPRPVPAAASRTTSAACSVLPPGAPTSRYRAGSRLRARTVRWKKPLPNRSPAAGTVRRRALRPVGRSPLCPDMEGETKEIAHDRAAEVEAKVEVETGRHVKA